jgi:hypothetical protein
MAGMPCVPDTTILNIATKEIALSNDDFIGLLASPQVVNCKCQSPIFNARARIDDMGRARRQYSGIGADEPQAIAAFVTFCPISVHFSARRGEIGRRVQTASKPTPKITARESRWA